ncbi:FAD-dependent oxidoreductase [Nocardioides sp. AE5]|uniref:FAD-dependent oxidoreductase n=1 Tax=Nocardioides sp. AE5 TaxID=2962573 RepID=UPI002882B9F3|nr:FAD-dependent oxidoreductase [Nocardioides sp. AE5]MDT0201013.1 FAD-dependent oxidoreductase [Nocardioides sp. AE5]
MARVIVVGAGVVGLTCAVRLLERGHAVSVVARDLPLETTSAVAGAFWYPYRALPRERVTAWAAASYAEYVGLSADPASGVRMLSGTEVSRERLPDPWWREAVPSLAREVDVPPGYVDGYTFRTPVVDMPVHLRWLVARIDDLGGTITRMNLSALPTGGDLVVNCAGLGARHLATDRTLTPVAGQVVVVEQFGLDRWWLDAAGPTYVVPRGEVVVVGGTDAPGEWNRTPSPEVAARILARAARLVPALADARVVRHKVGLRPVRPAVRTERVGDVIHCYGHGGAGVTLAWGTADEVAALASRG